MTDGTSQGDRSSEVLSSLRRMMSSDAERARKAEESSGETGPVTPEDEPLELADAVDEEPLDLGEIAEAADAGAEESVAPAEPVALPDEEPLPVDAPGEAPVDENADSPVDLDEPLEGGAPVELDELFEEDAAVTAAEAAAVAEGDDPSAPDPAAAEPEDDAPAPPDWEDTSSARPGSGLPARIGEEARDGLPVDEAQLEELIRRIIREELVEGEIGQNISRNVLRLVRQEIDRTLTRRGL